MTPAFRILVENRQDVTAVVTDRLLGLRLTDAAGFDSDTLELRLDDRGARLGFPRKGVRLSVSLGYVETGLVAKGDYLVDEVTVEGPPDTMIVRAKAADLRTSQLKSRRSRSFDGKTLGEIAGAIAGEHGLQLAITTDLAAVALQHVAQSGESDLALLTRLSRQCDAVAKIAGGRLVIARRGESSSASGQDLDAVALTRPQLTHWSMTDSDRDRHGKTVARTYDYDSASHMTEQTGDAAGPDFVLKHPLPDRHSANRAAKARKRALERGAATLSLELPGVAVLVAESPIDISGVRKGVDGRWIVEHVEHVIEGGGYSCRVEATRGDPVQQTKAAKAAKKAGKKLQVLEYDLATGQMTEPK